MTGSHPTGQVLGASTSVAAGIGLLPKTSGSPLLFSLAVLAIFSGVVVLGGFVISKIVK